MASTEPAPACALLDVNVLIALHDQQHVHHEVAARWFDRHGRMHGHRQLTDLYLLALAVAHEGRFVTFDARIPLNAVRGALAEHLVSI